MPLVRFTYAIQRHVACPNQQVAGSTVHAALEAVFAGNPAARAYILDDQGELRHHMIIFVNGEAVRDRRRLTDPVEENAEIDVFQALSGG